MLQDLRFAYRSFAKRPVLYGLITVILGLGMGAATAVVDLTNLLAWRQLPVQQPQELVKIYSASRQGFVGPYGSTSFPDYEDYRDGSSSLAGLAAYSYGEYRLGRGDVTEYAQGAAVTGNFFQLLGLRADRGRLLSPEHDRLATAPVMVLGRHYWQSLGADPEVLGSTFTVDGRAFEVIGVGPPGFTGTVAGAPFDFYIPLRQLPSLPAERLKDRTATGFDLIGRFKPGVGRRQVRSEMTMLAQRLDEQHPSADEQPRRVTVTAGNITHPVDLARMQRSLSLLAGAVGLLLLITCSNVANLLLARAVSRRREMAIRRAVGAGRIRLIRQVLTESLVLAAAGGLLGLIVARGARTFLVRFAGPEMAGEMRFDANVLGMSFLICLAATLLFGLVPALRGTGINLVGGLKDVDSAGRRRISAGALLAGVQVGLSVVLMTAAALLSQSLHNYLQIDLGFDDEQLLIAAIVLPSEEYSRERGIAFFDQLQERAAALPGVEQAGTALIVPPIMFDISLSYRRPEDPERAYDSRINYVDETYFETMGITVEQGRGFAPTDAVSGHAVIVINRLVAQQLWPGENPIGRTLRLDSKRDGDLGPDYEVIGVVASVSQKSTSIGGEPMLYFSTTQRYRSRQQLVMRSTADPAATFDALRALVRDMDPSLALSQPRTGPANRREAFVFQGIQATAVASFAVLGFVLALIGIFGVMSHVVSCRRREIGIRMAIGARGRDVRRQVLRQGMVISTLGAGLGLLAIALGWNLMNDLLFGISSGDLWLVPAVFSTVLLSTAGAIYIPARRASAVEPSDILLGE